MHKKKVPGTSGYDAEAMTKVSLSIRTLIAQIEGNGNPNWEAGTKEKACKSLHNAVNALSYGVGSSDPTAVMVEKDITKVLQEANIMRGNSNGNRIIEICEEIEKLATKWSVLYMQ